MSLQFSSDANIKFKSILPATLTREASLMEALSSRNLDETKVRCRTIDCVFGSLNRMVKYRARVAALTQVQVDAL